MTQKLDQLRRQQLVNSSHCSDPNWTRVWYTHRWFSEKAVRVCSDEAEIWLEVQRSSFKLWTVVIIILIIKLPLVAISLYVSWGEAFPTAIVCIVVIGGIARGPDFCSIRFSKKNHVITSTRHFTFERKITQFDVGRDTVFETEFFEDSKYAVFQIHDPSQKTKWFDLCLNMIGQFSLSGTGYPELKKVLEEFVRQIQEALNDGTDDAHQEPSKS